ncbi:MAG: Uma2 family endonuclease [Gemmatimonadetes bacterium]|nr:Uma2 family endonuclease [Gemmatimonadota bacterium]
MVFPGRSEEHGLSLSDFEELPEEPGYRMELVGGRLVREPRPAPLHARVLSKLVHSLVDWAGYSGHGVVLTDAGFVLAEDPVTVRVPDVSFVSKERIPADDPYGQGFWHMAPDLAAEVLSPSNTATEIQQKVLEYFEAGARAAWIVDPRLRTVTVCDSATKARLLIGEAELDGGSVLPGLRLPLASLFDL